MRCDLSLGKGGLITVVAGLAAAGALLFFTGLLLGTAAAAGEPTPALRAHSPAAPGPAEPFPSSAGPCPAPAEPPAPADPPAVAAARAVDAPESREAPVATFRDERRAVALLDRLTARGVDAVIVAEAAADGSAVFRVVPARAASLAGAP